MHRYKVAKHGAFIPPLKSKESQRSETRVHNPRLEHRGYSNIFFKQTFEFYRTFHHTGCKSCRVSLLQEKGAHPAVRAFISFRVEARAREHVQNARTAFQPGILTVQQAGSAIRYCLYTCVGAHAPRLAPPAGLASALPRCASSALGETGCHRGVPTRGSGRGRFWAG